MKITFLGQAGLLFETGNIKIAVDPYFSDSVGKTDDRKRRRSPVPPLFSHLSPDVLLFTHAHLDHYDPETAERILKHAAKPVLVIGPRSVWEQVRLLGGDHNYVLFSPGCRWSMEEAVIYGTEAVHSDPYAMGFVIEAEGKRYWITGDTLYSKALLEGLPLPLEAVFLPVNGVGNNMNARDARLLAEKTEAKFAVPLHTGLLDDLTPRVFLGKNRVLPEIWKEIVL